MFKFQNNRRSISVPALVKIFKDFVDACLDIAPFEYRFRIMKIIERRLVASIWNWCVDNIESLFTIHDGIQNIKRCSNCCHMRVEVQAMVRIILRSDHSSSQPLLLLNHNRRKITAREQESK